MRSLEKNWDHYVIQAETIARSDGFHSLRDLIMSRARVSGGEDVLDVGAGTGLLTFPAAHSAESVWAVDISPAMCEYLNAKTESAGLTNVRTVCASAASLPLVEASVDVVVSNYCFHHLPDDGKASAVNEAFRVLKPGGRIVFADMMFSATMADPRSRRVARDKVSAMLRRGPSGYFRVAKNALRFATASWEKPATKNWWEQTLRQAGFENVEVQTLVHEGGIASGRRPV